MEKSIVYKIQSNDKIVIASTALLGAALITFCSFIKIPLYPVPFTLQTLAIYILALTQGPKQAFASTLFYLVCATVGLPVFGGRINPAWIFGKCGGYLVGFPIAAYCMAKIYATHGQKLKIWAQRDTVKSKPCPPNDEALPQVGRVRRRIDLTKLQPAQILSFWLRAAYSKRPAFQALLCGMGVIFFFGFLWLIPIFGLQTAFIKGVFIFIPSEIFKALAAIQLVTWRNKRSKK